MFLKWKVIERVLILLGTSVAFTGLFFNWNEIRNLRLNESADIVLRLDEHFNTPTTLKIIETIEDGEPLLREHGGNFERWQIDSYLGMYETLYDLYSHNLIDEGMLYSAFSYNLENAYRNVEISGYVLELQKDDVDVFGGFQTLGKFYTEGKNKNVE